MGKSKHLTKVLELFEKSPVVDFKSISRITGNINYAKLLVFHLLKKKIIQKLIKGYYTKHHDISLAVLCLKPAYLGLHNAMSFHNVWEQETIPVIITSKKVKTGIRRINNNNILIRKTNPAYLFGIEYLQDGNYYLPYSDVEKTLIDMVVYKERISPEVMKNFKKRINILKLKNYLRHYSKKTQDNVLKIIKMQTKFRLRYPQGHF